MDERIANACNFIFTGFLLSKNFIRFCFDSNCGGDARAATASATVVLLAKIWTVERKPTALTSTSAGAINQFGYRVAALRLRKLRKLLRCREPQLMTSLAFCAGAG